MQQPGRRQGSIQQFSGIPYAGWVVMAALSAMAIGLSGCQATELSSSSQARQGDAAQTSPSPVKVSLQALLDQTADDATLRVSTGRYLLDQGLMIQGRRNLTILCEPGVEVFLTDLNQDVVTIADSRHVRLQGGHFRHVTPLKEYECHGSVVRVINSRDVTITSAELDGCGAIGVAAQAVQNLTVSHCHIHSNTFNALYMTQVHRLRLHSNIIAGNANTMQLYGVDDLEMSDNIIHGNTGYWRVPAHPPGPVRAD